MSDSLMVMIFVFKHFKQLIYFNPPVCMSVVFGVGYSYRF